MGAEAKSPDVEPLPRSFWKQLLTRHNLRPDKRLGQNFLVEHWALTMVVRAAELEGDETVLEIGAGLGGLTRLLAAGANRVVAVEFDQRLIQPLTEVLTPFPNVRLIAGDVLQLDLPELMGGQPYRVVANIPYNITSALLRKLMEADEPAEMVVLTVQRELAERVVAEPGDLSLLALAVQMYGEPEMVDTVPARAFFPSPRVDSAVLRIHVYDEPALPLDRVDVVFTLARAGFQQKRKQLRNALAHGLSLERKRIELWLEEAGIEARSRAQELSIEAWGRLAQVAEIEAGADLG